MLITDAEGNEIEVMTAEDVAAQVTAEAERVKAESEEALAKIQEEHTAALAAKDEHIAGKLNEFIAGKKGVKEKEEELTEKEQAAQDKLDEALRIAQEANDRVTKSEQTKNDTLKKHWIAQAVGTDEDLIAKIEANYDLLNIDIKEDGDIARRVQLAVNMVPGLEITNIPDVSFGGAGGGMAPQFNSKEENEKAADYNEWVEELGLPKISE